MSKPTSEPRRPGRPRKDAVTAEDRERYSPKEIHWMWQKFKGDKDEIAIIMGLAVCDRNTAIRLSQDFWRQYEREQRERSSEWA